MKLFVSSLITFLLFLGPVVLFVLGWPVEGDLVKRIRLYPSFYLLIVCVGYYLLSHEINVKKHWAALTIIAVVFLFYIVNKFAGKSLGKMVCFNSMVLPALYYLYFTALKRNYRIKMYVKGILLTMFSANCLMSIYERYSMTQFFPIEMIRSDIYFADETENTLYRSSALLGHPLSNALIISIIMIFILTSSIGAKIKLSLYALGMVSLFCFNARGAIMISILTLFLYLIQPFFRKKKSLKKIISTSFFSIFAVILLNLLFERNVAGRFVGQGGLLSDNSSRARIEVWNLFWQYDLRDLLWGMSDVEEKAERVLGFVHIENWFILSTMLVGLLLTLIVIVLFIPVFKKSLSYYDRFTCIIILISTIGIASTNNSLACGVPALATFFTCCYAFEKTL